MEIRESILYSIVVISICLTIGTIAYVIYCYNVEYAKYVHEQRMAEIESRVEREKNLLQQGFIIQDSGHGHIVWPIPTGHTKGYNHLEANN